MRTLTFSRHRRGGLYRLLALSAGLGLAMASPPVNGAPNEWKKLDGGHAETSRAELQRLLERDGLKETEPLLRHPYLLRLEIKDAGGGSARHSEVVVRFRSLPAKALAKAWSPGGQEPGRAQLGVFSECKEKMGAVGRSCPLNYNGRGFVDVTSSFTDRNILFVHDPARKGQGHTVLWFSSEQSQEHLWFYVVPKTGFPSFGFGRLSVKKFRVPSPEPLAKLPGDPPDPGNGPRPGPGPGPDPRPLPPPDRPGGPGPDPLPDPRPGP
ncbi:MAG: hypothetical protein RBU30_10385, partial [Polyangia bacterium]|nr:hypothetical protein [Polyangia bacterium]